MLRRSTSRFKVLIVYNKKGTGNCPFFLDLDYRIDGFGDELASEFKRNERLSESRITRIKRFRDGRSAFQADCIGFKELTDGDSS
jgi:hypothetical protein